MEGLCELSPIQDVWIDGTHHVEIIGGVFRTVYFKWKQIDGIWRKVATDFALLRPVGTGMYDPTNWEVPVLELNGLYRRASH